MNSLQLKRNQRVNMELMEEYFSFKWKEKLKKEVFIKASILALILFTVLFVLTENVFFLVAIFSSLLFIIYSVAVFFVTKRKYLNTIRKKKPEVEEYEIAYFEKGIHYKLPNAESNFEWTYFKFYETHGETIYLYNNDGSKIFDIFSDRIHGMTAFLELKNLIFRYVPQK